MVRRISLQICGAVKVKAWHPNSVLGAWRGSWSEEQSTQLDYWRDIIRQRGAEMREMIKNE